MTTLRYTGYHEAGHAVAAIYLGIEFSTLTVEPSEHAAGCIRYEDPPPEVAEAISNEDDNDPHFRQWFEHSLMVTMAGAIAQRRFSPRSDWRYGAGDDPQLGFVVPGSDLQHTIRDIDRLHSPGEVAHAYEVYLRKRAEALVKAHWHEIVKVAEALAWRKTMMADEVREILFPDFLKDERTPAGASTPKHGCGKAGDT